MSEKKTIVWLLPGIDTMPTGGYKVVYEYANRFVADGYDVFIVYPQFLKFSRYKNIFLSFLKRCKNLLRYSCNKIKRIRCAPNWFQLDSRIHCEYVFRFGNSRTLKIHGARFVATALATSFELAGTRWIEDKDKFYFIQDFENWNGITSERVYDSYRLPLKKITIAPWLAKEVERTGCTAALVENGFDFDYFKMTNPIETRPACEVAMLYHRDERKRCVDAIAALKIVKEKIPCLHVTMFGTPEHPDVPEWFTYFQRPDRGTHNAIYNNASIFVAASRAEGFALPPCEAFICGCALCCTDIGGFGVYAVEGKTALTCPVCDYQKLAENIIKLIENNELRIELAKNGSEFIRQFTWERAYGKFKREIEV